MKRYNNTINKCNNSFSEIIIYNKHIRGFTVLEVVVAIFIFGVISAALLKMLSTADRIRGRANQVMESVVIAQNEADRVRNAGAFQETPLDCTYTATVNKREFDVERRIVQNEYGDPTTNDRLVEIELLIKEKSSSDSIKFRFLQGYTW